MALFGFDFIIDSDYRPIMIELNHNPQGKGQNVLMKWINTKVNADWLTLMGPKIISPTLNDTRKRVERENIISHLERASRTGEYKMVFPTIGNY